MKIKSRLFAIISLTCSVVMAVITIRHMNLSSIANDDFLIENVTRQVSLSNNAWIILLLCVVIAILAVVDIVFNGIITKKLISKFIGAALVLIALIFGIYTTVSITNNIDMMKLEAINRSMITLSLADLSELRNSGFAAVYIKQTDCQKCVEVDSELGDFMAVNQQRTILVYNTSQDRDGESKEEMSAVLEDLQVYSVPTIIVVDNGEVVERFDNSETMVNDYIAYTKQ